jgi:RES domain-containing protein
LTLSAWRIVQERHAAEAFSGEGARLYGGRWNSPGIPMIYTAQSRALAALEMLVHLDSPLLLRSFLLFEVTFDDAAVMEINPTDLPANWRDEPVPPGTQAIGDAWAAKAATPILRVPSVLIPQEGNFLLNPRHPEMSKVQFGKPEQFAFDPRLRDR